MAVIDYTRKSRLERLAVRQREASKGQSRPKCRMSYCGGRMNFCPDRDHVREDLRPTKENYNRQEGTGKSFIWDGIVMECEECHTHIHIKSNLIASVPDDLTDTGEENENRSDAEGLLDPSDESGDTRE